ncbi:glycerate kinase, partial [Escherichia coli]
MNPARLYTPCNEPVFTGDGKTAVIEMAAASGLMLVAPEKRNPL